MTKIDALIKVRNLFIATTFLLFAGSAIFAYLANWWLTPFDYWLLWASFGLGLTSFITGIYAIVLAAELIDSSRHN